MPFDWFDRDVRVDVIDRLGNRKNLETWPPLLDDLSRQSRVAGSFLKIAVPYVDEATVVVYIDGTLMESYFLKGGEAPRKVNPRDTPERY